MNARQKITYSTVAEVIAEVLPEQLRTASEVAGHFGVSLHTLLEHCPNVRGQTRVF